MVWLPSCVLYVICVCMCAHMHVCVCVFFGFFLLVSLSVLYVCTVQADSKHFPGGSRRWCGRHGVCIISFVSVCVCSDSRHSQRVPGGGHSQCAVLSGGLSSGSVWSQKEVQCPSSGKAAIIMCHAHRTFIPSVLLPSSGIPFHKQSGKQIPWQHSADV